MSDFAEFAKKYLQVKGELKPTKAQADFMQKAIEAARDGRKLRIVHTTPRQVATSHTIAYLKAMGIEFAVVSANQESRSRLEIHVAGAQSPSDILPAEDA